MTWALLIYTRTPGDPEPAELARVLDAHRRVQDEAHASGELHAVARLDERTTARTVRKEGDLFQVIDGPFLETREWLVGFYLVDCPDEETALARARAICPRDGCVEVRPARWRWQP